MGVGKCDKMIAIIILLAVFVTITFASWGDKDPDFQTCLANCLVGRQCSNNHYATHGLPFHLRLLGWNCLSNCKYDCMWHMVDTYRSNGEPLVQYYGKWPFLRIFGIQELASVIFSAANGYAHLIGFRQFKARLGQKNLASLFMYPFYRIYCYSTVVAWSAAVIFHTRDLPWTEHADYLTAIASVFVGLYCAILRHFHVTNRKSQLYVALPLMILLSYHLYYMLAVKFDYTWNMILLAIMFGTYCLIWLSFGIRNFASKKHARKAVLWVILALACGSLELVEFEPVADLLDAHALWHLSTVPLAWLMWDIFTEDALDLLENPSLAKSSHSNM